MKSNPFDRLKLDTEANKWWQEVLNDPRYALVVEAAKHMLIVEPEDPSRMGTASAVEVGALMHAAHRGGIAAFMMLERMGSDTFAEMRQREGQAQAAQHFNPQTAGRGYGRASQGPPEIRSRDNG